jgi:protein FRG1
MVKPLSFKGDKKSKKRKRRDDEDRKPSEITTARGKADNFQEGDPSADSNEPDQSWVTADVPTDIGGPVIFVLPTSPTTCLACDANGKVFASELENIVDGDPSTAEPHDVRQVWVTTKVAGSESVGFKGHHGR